MQNILPPTMNLSICLILLRGHVIGLPTDTIRMNCDSRDGFLSPVSSRITTLAIFVSPPPLISTAILARNFRAAYRRLRHMRTYTPNSTHPYTHTYIHIYPVFLVSRRGK